MRFSSAIVVPHNTIDPLHSMADRIHQLLHPELVTAKSTETTSVTLDAARLPAPGKNPKADQAGPDVPDITQKRKHLRGTKPDKTSSAKSAKARAKYEPRPSRAASKAIDRQEPKTTSRPRPSNESNNSKLLKSKASAIPDRNPAVNSNLSPNLITGDSTVQSLGGLAAANAQDEACIPSPSEAECKPLPLVSSSSLDQGAMNTRQSVSTGKEKQQKWRPLDWQWPDEPIITEIPWTTPLQSAPTSQRQTQQKTISRPGKQHWSTGRREPRKVQESTLAHINSSSLHEKHAVEGVTYDYATILDLPDELLDMIIGMVMCVEGSMEVDHRWKHKCDKEVFAHHFSILYVAERDANLITQMNFAEADTRNVMTRTMCMVRDRHNTPSSALYRIGRAHYYKNTFHFNLDYFQTLPSMMQHWGLGPFTDKECQEGEVDIFPWPSAARLASSLWVYSNKGNFYDLPRCLRAFHNLKCIVVDIRCDGGRDRRVEVEATMDVKQIFEEKGFQLKYIGIVDQDAESIQLQLKLSLKDYLRNESLYGPKGEADELEW